MNKYRLRFFEVGYPYSFSGLLDLEFFLGLRVTFRFSLLIIIACI